MPQIQLGSRHPVAQTVTGSMSLAKRAYHVEVADRMDDPEWDAFLRATPGGSYQQTSLWARAKSFVRLKPKRVVIRHGGKIIAGAQMLVRSVRPLGAIGYVTRGPVVAREHSGLADLVLKELDRLGRKEDVRCLVVQPPAADEVLAAQMLAWDSCPTFLSPAPVATLLVNLGKDLNAIMGAMRKTTRYDIR